MNINDWFKLQKFDFVVGVPCSDIKEFISQIEYIPATREDEAIGIAVGAYLAGKKPLVFMQNSGLGVSINAILSLLKPYDIHITLLISQHSSAEHHVHTTAATERILNVIDYKDYILVKNEEIYEP